jgi:cell fate (sporulation/competence/biofilm development) regulator YlbF (YheA/YmcA/DUF963 family)
MSIETSAEERVTELGAELGEAIAELEEYQRFAGAKAAVEENEAAQERIEAFERIREEFMLARQAGDATQEDLREVQRAREALHEVPVLSDFLEAQSELELRLQEVNEYISDPLAIDFGEKAGGCCQDE